MFDDERVERLLVAVEAHREPAVLLEPEVAVEPRLQVRGARRGARSARSSSPASVGEVRAGEQRRVHVPLHLAQRDRRLARADRRRSGSSRASPSSPGSAGRGRWCAGTRRSRRRRGRRTRRSTRARGRRRGAARRPPRGGCPTAAARRAASRTAAWRRRCRSRRCRRRATARPISPKRISWRMRPGSSSVTGFTSRPWKRASVCSVPSARSESTIIAIHDVMSESRPNSVMNHGAPAATTVRSGCSGSKRRSAARSSVERSSSALEAVVVGRDRRQVRAATPRGAASGVDALDRARRTGSGASTSLLVDDRRELDAHRPLPARRARSPRRSRCGRVTSAAREKSRCAPRRKLPARVRPT